MRRPRGFVALAIVVLSAGVVSFVVLRPTGAIMVTVANETGQDLSWIAVEHGRGGERLDHVAPHEHRTLRLRTRGRSSITVRARFGDGQEVAVRRVRGETGQRLRFGVRDSTIDVRRLD